MTNFGGIVTALIVDSLIFTVLLVLFLFYRKYRSKKVPDAEHQPAFYESETSVLTVARGVYGYTKEEMLEHSKHEGWMYMSLYKCAFKSFVGASVLGLSILLPIYLIGHNKVLDPTDKTSIAHVIGEDLLMIAPVICVPIFSAIFYLTVYSYYKESKNSIAYTHEDKRSYDSFTVEINGLPRNTPAHELNPKIENYLNNEFPGAFLSVYVVPDYTEAYQCRIKIEEYTTKLSHYKEYEQIHQQRETTRVRFCTKKVDGIDYYEKKIEKLKKQEEAAFPNGLSRNVGKAYVMCNTTRQAKYMVQDYNPGNKNAVLSTRNWEIKRAPNPQDVLWQNLNSDPHANKFLHIVLTLGFFWIFLFVMTPTSFLVYTEKFLQDLHLNFLLTGFISGWLPTLCTLIYQSLVLPQCVKAIVKQERHHSKSAKFNSTLQKYFVYNLFYILILQLFSLQAVSFIDTVFTESSEGILLLMADSIANGGSLFCTFLVHSTLISGGFSLLSPDKLLKVYIKRSRAISETDQEKAYEINEFSLASNYAKNLTIIAIAQVYSVTFPLIMLAAVFYLGLHYWIDKHNFLVLYFVQPVGSRAISRRVLKFMVFYVFLFQLLTGGVIMLSGNEVYYGVGAALVVMAIVMLVLLLSMERRLIRKFKVLVFAEEEHQESINLDKDAYRHPCDHNEISS